MVGHLKHPVPPLSPTTAALSARSSISLPREFLARQAGLQVSHPAPHRRLEPQILRDGRRALPRRVWGGTAHHGAGQLDARHAHAVELEAVWLPRTLPLLERTHLSSTRRCGSLCSIRSTIKGDHHAPTSPTTWRAGALGGGVKVILLGGIEAVTTDVYLESYFIPPGPLSVSTSCTLSVGGGECSLYGFLQLPCSVGGRERARRRPCGERSSDANRRRRPSAARGCSRPPPRRNHVV